MSENLDDAAISESIRALQPLDVDLAATVLRETKQIMNDLGVVFFLRQGTCLGAIRDNGFISWDDDLDIGSVIGLHGLTERSIDRVVTSFRDNGYLATILRNAHFIFVALIKASVRLEWTCYKIFNDSIFHYPGVQIPLRLFTELKEIDFIGEKFLVPNPPEEYLRCKYGADWMTPKQNGYEKDIVQMVPQVALPGQAGGLRQFLTRQFLPWRAARLRVFDAEGEAVSGAEVVVVGLNCSRTNSQGYARFYLPCDDFYALVIRHGYHEEVLYEEKMTPGETYVYRPNPALATGRYFALTQE